MNVIQLDLYRPLAPAQKLRADRMALLTKMLIEAPPATKTSRIETRLVTIEDQLATVLDILNNSVEGVMS